jgi:hypothetical protein
MIDNGYYLLLVDGFNMWSLKFSDDTFEERTIPFNKPTRLAYLNQRIYCTNNSTIRDEATGEVPENNKLFWSELGYDGVLTWNALSFSSAEQNVDPIVSMVANQGELWLFGTASYEVHSITSNPDLPVQFRGGSASNIGCGAPDSVAEIMERIFWLGSSKAGKNIVYMSNGYNAQRISTHAIEYQLGQVETSNAVGFTYQEEGHIFYVLNLIDGDKTLVYDLTTQEWHERASRHPLRDTNHRWSPLYAVFAFNSIIMGNSEIPYLVKLSLDTYTEFDPRYSVGGDNQKPIKSDIYTPVYWDDLRTIIHDELVIDVDTGQGLQNNNTAGVGRDPQIMMSYADDGGYLWKPQQYRSIGQIGQYNQRVRFHRLGMSRERVYRISISDPIKKIILGARLRTRQGGI